MVPSPIASPADQAPRGEDILRAVCRRLDWYQGTLIPEAFVRYVAMGERRHYFADLVWVSEAGRATEFEIKVSREDWRADLAKTKWGRLPRWVARFVYVVPEELGIPPWVPSDAGVWHVKAPDHRGRRAVKTVCSGGLLGNDSVPEKILTVWNRQMYGRFWQQYLYTRGAAIPRG